MISWEPKRGNCLLWALYMRIKHGGCIKWRWSLLSWVPHFFWSPNGYHLFEYVPKTYKNDRWYSPFLFEGHVQEVAREQVIKTIINNGQHKIELIEVNIRN